ncbi:hypothetical protein [Bacillus suaedae]|uniref:Uncharacterized protein n=1 Tax=Halalkalibacter suaedae TaxID=2822140 RepID=A0A941AQ44_9BACI|nr:hypothetical protein [Bacillus suaedae]MBP3952212.1 hypothetical protein [Bacillus suaedae]
MFFDKSLDWSNLDQDAFQILVKKAIYDLEKQNAVRALPRFLQTVYEEYRNIEQAKEMGVYPFEQSTAEIAAANLHMPIGTYEAFLDQARARIDMLLR